MKPSQPREPLRILDFKVIQEPLEGLLRNMDEDLKRQLRSLEPLNHDHNARRELSMLLIALRLARSSYHAIAFLMTDLDPHPKRQPNYVLVLPPINRQIMDLWFSLVYILDDFKARILSFEQTAYRQLREQIDKTRRRHGPDPDWSDWFVEMEDLARKMEGEVHITNEQKADPSRKIPSWPNTFDLSTKSSKSQAFLTFLNDEIYGEMSIAAHLKPAGFMHESGLVLTDMFSDHQKTTVEERTIHQFKFRHYFHTVIILTGIISEIEMHCKLGNAAQVGKVWQRMAAWNSNARDIYEFRYKRYFP